MPDPDKQIVAFYNLENLFDTVDDPGKEDNDYLPSLGYRKLKTRPS